MHETRGNMASQLRPIDSATHTAARLGCYLAIITSLLTLGTFTIAFILALAALVGTSIIYGIEREYRFEIVIITGFLLSIVCKRATQAA